MYARNYSQAEFRRWEKTMKSEKQNLPSASTLKRKRVDLDKARKYAFTNVWWNKTMRLRLACALTYICPISRRLLQEEVDAIIQEKAKIVPTAKNLSRERVKLLYAKDQLAQDGLDASHVTSKLHKIDSIIEEMKPAKVDVWAKLNERNRKRNVAEGSQAEILARSDKVKGSARTGNDPFARIKAVPTQIFETPSGEDGLVGPSTSPIKQQPSPHVIDGDGRSTNGHVTMETATTHNAGASSFDSLFDDIDI